MHSPRLVVVHLVVAFCAMASGFSGVAIAQSPTPLDYDVETTIPLVSRSFFSGGREERIDADLFRPRRQGRLPAAVITPSSGGVATHVELYYARLMARHGMAVLVVDSFTPRGILRTVEDQSQLQYWQSIADAVAGRNWLARQDYIDPERIIVLGMSKGAVVANRLAMIGELAAQRIENVRFAAHVAIVPSCTVQMEDARTTGAPMLFMLAEQDDYTLVPPCLEYVQRIKAAGAANIRLAVYLGARHAFESGAGIVAMPAQKWRSECSYFRRDVRTFVNRRSGAVVAGSQLTAETNRDCETTESVHIGGEPGARDQSSRDLVQFLNEYGLIVDVDARAATPDCASLQEPLQAACSRARAGFAGEAALLARAYLRGRGVAADATQARRLFEFAASRGSPQAKWELALMLRDKLGGAADMPRALKLLHDAAAAEEAPAMSILGVMARDGIGRAVNARESVEWFRRAAQLRNGWAMAHYGRALMAGLGDVKRDPAEAVRYFKLSAFRGNPLGKLYYGEVLAGGVSAPQDKIAALRLFEEARSAVDADAWIRRRADEATRRLQSAGAK